MPFPVVLISTLRALIEVAALMLVLRGVLWLFGPRARKGNFVYDILTVGVTPFLNITYAITRCSASLERYVAPIAFLLLIMLWVAVGLAQQALCTSAHCV